MLGVRYPATLTARKASRPLRALASGFHRRGGRCSSRSDQQGLPHLLTGRKGQHRQRISGQRPAHPSAAKPGDIARPVIWPDASTSLSPSLEAPAPAARRSLLQRLDSSGKPGTNARRPALGSLAGRPWPFGRHPSNGPSCGKSIHRPGGAGGPFKFEWTCVFKYTLGVLSSQCCQLAEGRSAAHSPPRYSSKGFKPFGLGKPALMTRGAWTRPSSEGVTAPHARRSSPVHERSRPGRTHKVRTGLASAWRRFDRAQRNPLYSQRLRFGTDAVQANPAASLWR